MSFRIGHGHDVHRLVPGRELWLGGIQVPFDKGLDGHSDADVLIHAICDALLGAMAEGDIGKHFPDTDNTFKDADSKFILKEVNNLLKKNGYAIANIDSTLVIQKPKIAPYIDDMRKTLANVLDIDTDRISVKATTSEGLGPEGRGECISAYAVVLIEVPGS